MCLLSLLHSALTGRRGTQGPKMQTYISLMPALTCLFARAQADEARKAQIEAHGQMASMVVEDKVAAPAAGPASYAPTM